MSFRRFFFSLTGILFIFAGVANSIVITSDSDGFIRDLGDVDSV